MLAAPSLFVPAKRYRADTLRNRLVLTTLGAYTLVISSISLSPGVIKFVADDILPPSMITAELARLGFTVHFGTTFVTALGSLLAAIMLFVGLRTQAAATQEFAPATTGRVIAYALTVSHLLVISLLVGVIAGLLAQTLW